MVKYLLLKLLSSGLMYTSESDTPVVAITFPAPQGALTCASVAKITGEHGTCEIRDTRAFLSCNTVGECSEPDERKRWVKLGTLLGNAQTFVYSVQPGEYRAYTLQSDGRTVTGVKVEIVET